MNSIKPLSIHLFLTICLALSFISVSAQSDVCEVFKKIISASGDEFESLKGESIGDELMPEWKATRQLPNTEYAVVYELLGVVYENILSTKGNAEDLREDYHQWVKKIKPCLSSYWATSTKSNSQSFSGEFFEAVNEQGGLVVTIAIREGIEDINSYELIVEVAPSWF